MKYKRYEFCKARLCGELIENEICTLKDGACHYTAKELHGWLKEQGFIIAKPPFQPNDPPDHEHPAVSKGKSAKEIQKGYRDYLRSHHGR